MYCGANIVARLIFENLSLEDAKMLAEWYEGQGEQDADVWFECYNVDSSPKVDVRHKGGCMKTVGNAVFLYMQERE